MKYFWVALLIFLFAYFWFLNEQRKRQTPNPKLVRRLPDNKIGMTIPPFGMYVTNYSAAEHEICHWKQYQKFGFVKFWYKYITQTLENGYEENELEKECYNEIRT